MLLVRDVHLGKQLALKLLHEALAAAGDIQILEREFSILSRLEHPGIARVHDFGYAGKRPFFTSEYIPGVSLAAAGQGLSAGELLALAIEVSAAVAFLHASEILHLDIKPSNIILSGAGPRSRPVLIDFGLVRKGLKSPPGRRVMGSLPYMAPEYFREGHLGPWTDVYALGVTLHRLAAGDFPRPDAPRSLSRLSPGFPPALENIILKCLAPDPEARFPSANELHAALEAAGEERKGILPERRPAPPREATAGLTLGREAEIARVDRFLDNLAARGRGPRVLALTGPPGMGQTHLLRELKVRAQTRGLSCYLETGFPGRAPAPGSLLRCLGAHLSNGEARERWEAFLARLRRPQRSLRDEIATEERRLRRAEAVQLAASAVEGPLVIAADRLQYWDEVSLELWLALVRFLAECPEATPLGLVAGYREEGPGRALLQEISSAFIKPEKGLVLTLKPLGLLETALLYRARAGGSGGERSEFEIFQETGGCPSRIIACAAREHGGGGGPRVARPLDQPKEGRAPLRPAALDPRSRALLLLIDLLERPATTAELSRYLGVSRMNLQRELAELERMERAVEVEASDGGGWLIGPLARGIGNQARPEEKRRLHLLIARTLAGKAGGRDDPVLLEALRHFQAAGSKPDVVRLGIPVARALRSAYQNRAALHVLRLAYDALPGRSLLLRAEAAIEMAGLRVQAGDIEEGIRILQDILLRLRKQGSPRLKRRVLLWLAVLHRRRGDFQRADLLLAEGMRAGEGRAARLPADEFLFFLNEHAAVKAFRGEHAQARELCEAGLSLCGKPRGFRRRELALDLHATRANVALREFHFEAAVRDFEAALAIAEAIGALGNRAVILNNLGIVHSQCDRHAEALRAFREAEAICLRMDEGPSLASLSANLAVLHAKLGDFAAMKSALERGERLGPAALGLRQRFILDHARGLCLLLEGRHADARTSLEAALISAQALGERYIVHFERVYRAEALIFESAYGEAWRELARLVAEDAPPRARRMALARQAYLAALIAQDEAVPRLEAAHREVESGRPIPHLDAWDQLFFGWAFAVAGAAAEARARLDPAEAYFRRQGLVPGLALATCARTEGLFLTGDPAAARQLAATAGAQGNPLAAAIRSLLLARLALEDAGADPERTASAAHLADAGVLLIGNPHPEWELRLEALRAALDPGGEEGRARIQARREAIARDLPEAMRGPYLASRHWRRWTEGFTAPRARGRSPRRARGSDPSATATVVVDRLSPRKSLVARSPGMKKLVAVLERIRGTELPVVIQGETGTGKDLVARIIHAESGRAALPFVVIDCAALPVNLMESELFGAGAGAFTGQSTSRAGLLAQVGGGTVLVDQVSSLSLEAQAKLLRVLSEGRVRPLGSEEEIAVDARFLFSASRDLEAMVQEKLFRADLLHRISVLTLRVPPLRERAADVEELARAFLAEGGAFPPVEDKALALLRAGAWPGNVRQLRNILLRLRLENPGGIDAEAVARALGERSTSSLFPPHVLAAKSLTSLQEGLEREYLLFHFRRLGGDSAALCRHLGISRKQLYRRCLRYKISLRRELKGLQQAPRPRG